jgi:hypothetical protein
MIKIIESTDGKYIGLNLNDTESTFILNGWEFTPTHREELVGGYIRYSTSQYVILTKTIH